jgi:hypothetical protein
MVDYTADTNKQEILELAHEAAIDAAYVLQDKAIQTLDSELIITSNNILKKSFLTKSIKDLDCTPEKCPECSYESICSIMQFTKKSGVVDNVIQNALDSLHEGLHRERRTGRFY